MKNFAIALGHCLMEDPEVLAPLIVLICCFGIIYVFATSIHAFIQASVHDVVADFNSGDVASTLDALSINPDKWTFLS